MFAVLALCCLGCNESPRQPARLAGEFMRPEAAPSSQPLPENASSTAHLEWIGAPVELQETRDVVVVEASIALDPRGGFLVGDLREAQARRFGPDGNLLWYFGRPGEGPGEFSGVSAVRRTPSGEIVIADIRGRVTRVDSTGQTVIDDFTAVSRGQIEHLEVLSDTLVVISTRHPPESDLPVLHIWDIRQEKRVRSFFRPYGNARNPFAANMAGWTRFSLRHDTLAVIFAVTDSVFFFRTDGTLLRSVALPSRHFRPVRAEIAPDRSRGRAGMVEWIRQFDLVADVHWMADGSLVVAYQEILADSGMTRRWHLLQMTSDGRALAEVQNVPALETADGDFLWLQAPETILPNVLARARIRR